MSSHVDAERSFQPLTNEDLSRLKLLADARHDAMRESCPGWCTARIATVLAQGAARHRVYGDRGVKDLDVYVIYALPPNELPRRYPYNRVIEAVDFGVSAHGRQIYSDADKSNPKLARRILRWQKFAGRRVDLMSSAIHFDGDARSSVQRWIASGANECLRTRHSRAWHLSRTPIITLDTPNYEVWWEGPAEEHER